jgi:hypothetical protein
MVSVKKLEYITQWLSLSFVVLLLTASVTCGSFSIPNNLDTQAEHLISGQKSKSEKTAEELPVISELKLNAIVTHFSSYDFDRVFLPIVQEWISVRISSVIPRIFNIPYYYLQFFRYVFGHHIAINAP